MESPTVRTQAHVLKALSHPVRLHILMLLTIGEACVCHIQATVGLPQATVSQHLRELRRWHLITCRREGAHVYYQAAAPHLAPLLQDLQTLVQGQEGRSSPPHKVRLIPRRGQCRCPQCQTAAQ